MDNKLSQLQRTTHWHYHLIANPPTPPTIFKTHNSRSANMSSTHVSEIDQTNNLNIDDNPYAQLGLIKNPNGSFTRFTEILPTSLPTPESDPTNPTSVLSKDLPINQENNAWARVYLPAAHTAAKLPLIVYFHGSGFVVGSPASTMFHKFCNEVAEEIPAVIVSVKYRLAPEHRLPAAYDDGMEALLWIRDSRDKWLGSNPNLVDFSRCYLMGSSAGANIAYQVGLRATSSVHDRILPFKIQGLILHQPYFGGEDRTQSEIKLADGEFPLHVSDMMWDLALPAGANRDHEYCNLRVGMESSAHLLEKVKDEGWRVLVYGWYGDLLVDRQVELAGMLQKKGIDVVSKFNEGGSHGAEFFDESKAKVFYGDLKMFLLSL